LRGENGLLASELSGILNLAMDGAKSLKEDGAFIKTEEQTKLLAEYREENSAVEAFLVECLEFEEGNTLNARELYESYNEYCKKGGRPPKSNISFTKEMRSIGARLKKFSFVERKNGKTPSVFEGLKVNDDWMRSSNTHASSYYSK
jgi:putative DNA primase/helicase